MTGTLDFRRIPARPDLAAAHLEGKVEASRFVEGVRREVMTPALPLKTEPGFDRPLETEALRGEYVMVYEENDEGWSWGQLERDGYVGWLPSEWLLPPAPRQTHRIAALRSFAYPGPSMKLPNTGAYSIGSRLSIVEEKNGFARTADGLFFHAGHLAPIDASEPDFVAVAERFLNVPYLWGGRTSLGLDCSALIQVSLDAAGIAAPRDSDMQAAELGETVEIVPGFTNLKRGDFVRWKGHCGIMLDERRLLHANGYHMAVAIEDLEEAVTRIAAKSFGPVTGIARLG